MKCVDLLCAQLSAVGKGGCWGGWRCWWTTGVSDILFFALQVKKACSKIRVSDENIFLNYFIYKKLIFKLKDVYLEYFECHTRKNGQPPFKGTRSC